MYQLKLDINENKIDEFVECVNSLLERFRKETGFLDISLYGDMEDNSTYILVGG